MLIKEKIEKIFDSKFNIPEDEAVSIFCELKFFLNKGEIRAAEFVNGKWCVNDWIKKGILIGFKFGKISEFSLNKFPFFDKHILSLKKIELEDKIRIVPGGSSIRDGVYIGKNVVMMPPSYINIASYIGDNTMIDSNVLVGSCAQIGKRVHLSAGCQIGGVLEPIGNLPVIIEDDVLVGGNVGIFEGVIIKKFCVIASGVQITSSTVVYDLVKKEILKKTENFPLTIPENAVVVMGSRKVDDGFANEFGISIYTPIIIKYRDDKTNRSTQLEKLLR